VAAQDDQRCHDEDQGQEAQGEFALTRRPRRGLRRELYGSPRGRR
jgi:hypothetical protein